MYNRRKIGIFAPYHRQDITTLAIRIAEIGQSAGAIVSFVVDGETDHDVNSKWDHEVIHLSQRKLALWAKEQDQTLWFSVNTAMDKNRENTLIVSWRGINDSHKSYLRKYNSIVTFSKEIQRAFEKRFKIQPKLITPLDTGIPRILRGEDEHWSPMAYFIHLSSGNDDKLCQFTVQLIKELMAADPSGYITLCSARASFSKFCLRKINSMLQGGDGRSVVVKRPTYWEYITTLMQHDWAILPDSADYFGARAAEAMDCGIPVLSFDVSPLSEIVKHESYGYLVGCDLRNSASDVQSAYMDKEKFFDAIKHIAGNRPLLYNCRRRLADRRDGRELFESQIRNLLHL